MTKIFKMESYFKTSRWCICFYGNTLKFFLAQFLNKLWLQLAGELQRRAEQVGSTSEL